MLRSTLLLLILGSGAASCGSPTDVAPLGAWGGEGVRLHVGPDGGELEFDCAWGTIDEPVVERGGSFVLDGTFSPGFGGPDVEGREPEVHPATWTGRIDGNELRLQGVFGDEFTSLGPYTLVKGADPRLRKCQ